MIPAPLRAIATSQQAWNILREDVTLRHSLMVREWNEQRQKDISGIDFDSNERGDSWYFPARVELEIRDTNERAQGLYDACCEVWEIHGLSKNRAFYRAVFEFCLEPLFATRRSCVQSELTRRDTLKRNPGNCTAALGSFARRMDQLRSRWNTRLEKETRDSETRERAARAREAQAGRTITRPEVSAFPTSKSKPGRPARLSHEFVAAAGRLWGEKQSATRRVSGGDLLSIADELDRENFVPPADFLPQKMAAELRQMNSKRAHSTSGAILSWTALVQSDDKDLVRTMRQLMSRSCKQMSENISGQKS